MGLLLHPHVTILKQTGYMIFKSRDYRKAARKGLHTEKQTTIKELGIRVCLTHSIIS